MTIFAYKDEISGKEIKELENAELDDYLTENTTEERYTVINKININRS